MTREKSFDQVAVDTMDVEDDINGITRRPRNRNKSNADDDNRVYNEFHIDIWFLVSEHLRPEDVGCFAKICKNTANVVSSAKFWTHLYKKYFKFVETIPERLQPDSMVRVGGLRASVIRSLYYTYDPFVERLKTNAKQNYQCLLRKVCVTSWCRPANKANYSFCFKFKQKMMEGSRCADSELKIKKKRVFDYYSDVFMNTEEGCQLLVVTTSSFRPLPNFFGHIPYLSSIVQNLSQGFTQNKLKLEFADNFRNNLGTVVYDPVLNIKVLDWWNPEYYEYQD